MCYEICDHRESINRGTKDEWKDTKCQDWSIRLQMLTPNVGLDTRQKCQNVSSHIIVPRVMMPWYNINI